MQILFETIAFCISIVAFIYGVLKIFATKAPFYFKMIICAVGCYSLEELWVIVNTFCKVENGTFSVRLIGIFGCFCTFLASNAMGFNKIVDDGNSKNKFARAFSFLAPALLLAVFCVYAIMIKSAIYIIIPFVVILPAIIDSYYELKYLILPNDEMGFVKYIRPISVLILLEYAISISYLLLESEIIMLIMDVASAIVMALLVLASRRGAIKWKTLI